MNLQLSLIGKWFKMSDDLIKTEDYREINEYWKRRLCRICSYIESDFFETETIDGKNQEVYYKFK